MTTAFLVVLGGASPAHANTGAPIDGAGSTWAQDQIGQWGVAVQRQGFGTVHYSGTGSIDGRGQFRSGTVDFAASELPYGLNEDGFTDPPPTRPFAYLPVMAGSIGFTYNVRVNGRRITDLRLSGTTVAGIFTRTITRWNDPAIQADNPRTTLPATAITPVVRADNNATTAGLTQWLSAGQPTVWGAYCSAAGRGPGCGTTTTFPTVPGDVAVAGSLGVTVETRFTNGAITYVESGYASSAGLPVASLLNTSGYYTAPTGGAVVVALSSATAGPSGLVDVTPAYTAPDPRTYPLPLVGHLIVPTTTGTGFTDEKGQTLASLGSYALCHQIATAGMESAPLPPHLVSAGLGIVRRIPGSSLSGVDTSNCVGAAAGELQNAPQPRACDRVGGPPCTDDNPGHRMETITTTLEPGALVISVAGSPHVELPSPELDPSGEHLHTTGQMTPVTVTDTRPGNIGWTATAQAGDFTDLAGDTIDASHLTWAPAVVDRGTAQSVTPGAPVVPGGGTGLKDVRTLATGTGPGTARVGARLDLDAPTSTPPGTYTAVLTLTVI
ncbi:substrate-binding domain-containing protein [Streptomyces sp. NPDC058691]|uniref:substrate-binding domain-containing protein n=1 Tax=Streptomyces sp. NPDC058691 TaxID=3346601 RepID=UPI00364BA909